MLSAYEECCAIPRGPAAGETFRMLDVILSCDSSLLYLYVFTFESRADSLSDGLAPPYERYPELKA